MFSLEKIPAVTMCSPDCLSEQSPRHAAQHFFMLERTAVASLCKEQTRNRTSAAEARDVHKVRDILCVVHIQAVVCSHVSDTGWNGSGSIPGVDSTVRGRRIYCVRLFGLHCKAEGNRKTV